MTSDLSMDLGRKDSEMSMWAPMCSWPKKRVEGIWESKKNRLTVMGNCGASFSYFPFLLKRFLCLPVQLWPLLY